MTAARSTYRRRRQSERLEPEFEEWFAGRRCMPITALAHPYCGEMLTYWRRWCTEHPGAVLPADFEAELFAVAALPSGEPTQSL